MSVKALTEMLNAQNTKYSDADDIAVQTGRAVQVWAAGHEKKIKVHAVSQLNYADACKYGSAFMKSLTDKTKINASLANIMLSLAVSMRNPEDLEDYLLKAPVRDDKMRLPFKLPEITVVDDGGEEDDEDLRALRNLNRISESIRDQVRKEDEKDQEDTDDEEDLSDAVKASYYSFVAGYLFRLQCRQVDSVFSSLEACKERFSGWYDSGKTLFDDNEIQKDSLAELKAVLVRKPELTGTWVMWLATTENERDLNKQPKGLLEYVGLQIYAYQGLHVMNQLLTLKALSRVPLGFLLRQLDCPITREGVKEVYHVIMDLEVTTKNPNRKTYFRYARVWSDGYFTSIRSATCAPLLYTIAKVVKDISADARSDPTQIYAIQNLGTALKEKLDKAAASLTKIILEQNTVDDESGDMWGSAEVAPS